MHAKINGIHPLPPNTELILEWSEIDEKRIRACVFVCYCIVAFDIFFSFLASLLFICSFIAAAFLLLSLALDLRDSFGF